jgi:hypothetical protein
VVVNSERAAGETIAPPRPCTPRERINITPLCAKPPTSDALANRASPNMNIRRRPNTSAIRPPSSRKPPNVSV